MSAQAPAAIFDQDAVRRAVDTALTDFLGLQCREAHRRGLPTQAAQALSSFLESGGKRIRPILCVAGWQAAGGTDTPAAVLKVAASLEMFHAFALIHDDIIDASDTRRGQPTVHRRISTEAAILIGDLALVFADELLHGAGLTSDQLRAALPIANTLHADTIYGQYLDISHTGRPPANAEQVLAITRYKTAKYTIEGPLLLGAALAGADPAVYSTLSAYGIPVGEAFQLRDDLLGVFGNPDDTGKAALDDLREGKATVLMALALHHATPAQHHALRRHVGNPHLSHADADQVRSILTDTGAHAAVEEMITQRRRSALTTLDTASLPPHITAALRSVAFSATRRTT
ncbi:polyprenyl synthetase family protein [Streptomyces sp. JH34]|uniref:polyprenyl synthetase family protein n=1 Tax=Streptomyces sp. JH34 TaxID=2793633 RepID=UPI0023F84410|nr:polyprenyl synthetase family protein [Streptomyces sp. JH34]MDF6016933.1 polyprenyl synthetase family protein [Streptomyces sp. JH34]